MFSVSMHLLVEKNLPYFCRNVPEKTPLDDDVHIYVFRYEVVLRSSFVCVCVQALAGGGDGVPGHLVQNDN